MRFVDLTGRRFHKLVVLEVHSRGHNVKWRCLCDCGNEAVVTTGNLQKRQPTMSCGCHRAAVLAALPDRCRKHNEASIPRGTITAEYRTWQSMKARCGNPRQPDYARYGGRGIRVCTRWVNDYPAFLADMGRRPSAKHSIDRIDVNGNYEPGNCRWATQSQQSMNTRDARMVTALGVTLNIVEWGRRTGIRWSTIHSRLARGWAPDRAVTDRVQVEKRNRLARHPVL